MLVNVDGCVFDTARGDKLVAQRLHGQWYVLGEGEYEVARGVDAERFEAARRFKSVHPVEALRLKGVL